MSHLRTRTLLLVVIAIAYESRFTVCSQQGSKYEDKEEVCTLDENGNMVRYKCSKDKTGFVEDEEANHTCSVGHEGPLCMHCCTNYSMAIGSNTCILDSACSNRYLMLLIVFAAAGILLFLFIKVLNMTVSQGAINGLIFYANVVWAYESLFLPDGTRDCGSDERFIRSYQYFFKVFIAWLNLDFGIETCFAEDLDMYEKTWLQYFFPLYILTIALIVVLLCRYSERCTRIFGNNAVPVIATVILLSQAKLLRTVTNVVMPSKIVDDTKLDGDNETISTVVWAFDGCMEYDVSVKHISLFAVATFVLFVLWLPFTLSLLCIQLLRKCSHFHVCCLMNKFMPLFEAYTGPFHPNAHFWVGLLCLVRGILLAINITTHYYDKDSLNSLFLVGTIILLLVVLYSSGKLYKEPIRLRFCSRFNTKVSFLSALEISFLLNLAALGIGGLFTDYLAHKENTCSKFAIFYTSIAIAFLQFIGICVWHIWNEIKSYRSRRRRESYEHIEGADTETVQPQTRSTLTVGTGTFLRNSDRIRESLLTEGSHRSV